MRSDPFSPTLRLAAMFQQNQIRKYCEYHFSISSVAAYLRKSPSIASEARLLLDHAQIGAHRERIVVTELEVWHVRMARCDAALKRAREFIKIDTAAKRAKRRRARMSTLAPRSNCMAGRTKFRDQCLPAANRILRLR